MNFFAIVILVQLFWSFSVTSISYSILDEDASQLSLFTENETANTLEDIAPQVEENVKNQFELPLIDAATLIFYTGTLLLDLILNFVTAVPQMIALLFYSITLFIPFNPILQGTLKLFVFVVATILYLIAFYTTITAQRSGTIAVA